jgi:isopenicillin-N epimerase
VTPAELAVYDAAADGRHQALREEFLLGPDVVFLNHGSFGACPRPVFERYQAWQLELERQPVEFLSRRLPGLLAHARAELAAYLGTAADELVYCPNVTTGLNVVARSLPLGPGDEVLTTDHEYGASERTWRFVCERRGARLVVQDLPLPLDDAAAVVERVWAAVTARTRVLFLSHITSKTAVVVPIQPLIERARAAGIWTVVDGAHAPGQVPVDLHAMGADFYAGNCHKWLCAPKGAGFLYAAPPVQDLLQPLVVGWGWRPEDPGPSPFIDQQQRQGTRDSAAYLAVPAAIAFQAERDWPRLQRECHQLLQTARDAIAGLTGLEPIVPDSPDWYAQMATIPLPPCDPVALQRQLYDEYRIEIPVLVWHDRPYLRLSIQGYNTRADVDRLVEALAHLLPPRSPVGPASLGA